jgi:hypothetical protein
LLVLILAFFVIPFLFDFDHEQVLDGAGPILASAALGSAVVFPLGIAAVVFRAIRP